MTMLTHQAFARARDYLFRHGRPLDQARFAFRFEHGPAGAVLDELARYQNPDGGFGHGLEPDLRTPASSAVATSFAFALLREVGASAADPVARRAIEYLVKAFDSERSVWTIVPPEVEDAPHAPWWTYADIDRTFNSSRINPTADLLGVLCDYAPLVPASLLADLTSTVLERLAAAPPEAIDFRCVVTLAAARHLPEPVHERVRRVLVEGASRVVDLNPDAWATYVLQPLDVAPSPQSPLAGVIDRGAIDANLDYWIDRQQPDGSWALSWNWSEVDQQAWQRAERDGKGHQIVERLAVLHEYGRA